jgi:hypothetical protein
MLRFDEDAFEDLAAEVGFCLDNLRHPDCELKYAGRFYELAAECLRAHAILRLLFDAKGDKFSNDLVMSGQARRAFLRRCRAAGYTNYYAARSRTGSLFDAIAGNDFGLAAEIAHLSPDEFRPGDEYEDDFYYQLYLGVSVSAPESGRAAILERFAAAAGDNNTRLQVCQALEGHNSAAFAEAFENLLLERKREIAADGAAKEDLTVAIGTKIFIEGVALLRLANRSGIPIAPEYAMCPAMALESRNPARPTDEFAHP